MPPAYTPPPPYGQYPTPYMVFKTELLEKHHKMKHYDYDY